MKDWREDYVICKHLAENPDKYMITPNRGFRVCCDECYKKGFLWKELQKSMDGKLCIGTIKE